MSELYRWLWFVRFVGYIVRHGRDQAWVGRVAVADFSYLNLQDTDVRAE
jgi:hypothetical protein